MRNSKPKEKVMKLIHLSGAENKMLRELAAQNGLSVSAYIRMIIRRLYADPARLRTAK